MKWSIDSFFPSDGSKQGGVTVDHTAWLKGESGPKTQYGTHENIVHISLNMSSRGVPEANAKAMLDAMVSGLNAMAATV